MPLALAAVSFFNRELLYGGLGPWVFVGQFLPRCCRVGGFYVAPMFVFDKLCFLGSRFLAVIFT